MDHRGTPSLSVMVFVWMLIAAVTVAVCRDCTTASDLTSWVLLSSLQMTHTRTHARTHTHTHTRTLLSPLQMTHTRTHARTHAHTLTHTHTQHPAGETNT